MFKNLSPGAIGIQANIEEGLVHWQSRRALRGWTLTSAKRVHWQTSTLSIMSKTSGRKQD